ncbi:hypothetical protein [Methanococcoides sp. FTZ1]|uniref:hypothetical protein n=1 Tax=Methanococcoides sp. FTZ1 TaxID=3439061 RepID=UPI003F86D7AB
MAGEIEPASPATDLLSKMKSSIKYNNSSFIYKGLDDAVLNDDRTIRGIDIVSMPEKHIQVIKTTREGVTTSMILACRQSGLRPLVIVPTNDIINKTIMQIPHKFNFPAKYIHIPTNFDCIINKDKIENNPKLSDMPYIMRGGKCYDEKEEKNNKAECKHYNTCKLTEVIREDEVDLYATTYHKWSALILAASLTNKEHHEKDVSAQNILDKILKNIDIIIYDEAHILQFPDSISYIINELNNYQARCSPINLNTVKNIQELVTKFEKLGLQLVIDDGDVEKYKDNLQGFIAKYEIEDYVRDSSFYGKPELKQILKRIPNEYKELKGIVKLLILIASSNEIIYAENKVIDMILSSDKRTYKKHQIVKIENPHYKLFCYDKKNNKPVSESIKVATIMGELEQLCTSGKVDELFILELYNILNIVQSKELVIDGQQDSNNNITIRINVVDTSLSNAVKRMTNKKQTFFTSATFGSQDYSDFTVSPSSQMLHGNKYKQNVKQVIFGDFFKTNSKMTIFPDKKTFSPFGRYSFKSMEDDIEKSCRFYFDQIGKNNFIVFCSSITECNNWRDKFTKLGYYEEDEKGNPTPDSPIITYYQSPDVMGVECDRRFGIAIGIQQLPSHAHDHFTESAEQSQISREEAMRMNVWQAWSRVKDPNGEELSFLIALGVNGRDCRNIVTWGSNLKTTIEHPEGEKAKTINVTVDEDISKPNIIDVFLHLKIAATVAENLLKCQRKGEKCHSINILRQNNGFRLHFDDKSSLLHRFLKVQKLSLKTKSDKKGKKYSKTLITNHIKGQNKLLYNPISKDNTTDAVHFVTSSDYERVLISLILDEKNISHHVFKDGKKYYIYVFIEETDSATAKLFAESILSACGFAIQGKNKTVDYFPKSKTYNRMNDYAVLPFGRNCEILGDGDLNVQRYRIPVKDTQVAQQAEDVKTYNKLNCSKLFLT